MKIKKIRIKGFRGFNESREIEFDERLTLVYAPNSYGKTSISESFEWLIYGNTSKVESAESKDEYKGSLRNVHLSISDNPRVTLFLTDGNNSKECTAELSGDQCQRYFDGKPVADWPFSHALRAAPPPFILQHALKNLLLAAPIKRFEDFAKLLGLEALSKIHRDLIAFCTKPPVPRSIQTVMVELESLLVRADATSSLKEIAKLLRKGTDSLGKSFELIWTRARALVPKETARDSILPRLLSIRDDAVAKFFKGKIELPQFSDSELAQNQQDENYLTATIAEEFISKYISLGILKGVQRTSDLTKLHELGIKFLDEEPSHCPLCKQKIDSTLLTHIREGHSKLQEEKQNFLELESQKSSIAASLTTLQTRLGDYHIRVRNKTATLLELESALEALAKILLPKYQPHYDSTVNAIAQLKECDKQFAAAYEDSKKKLKLAIEAVDSNCEEESSVKQLSASLISYIGRAAEYKAALEAHASPVADAARILKHELDTLAGTQEVSVIIDLISSRPRLAKKFQIETAVESLKDLKQQVDRFVSEKMLDVISGEFGTEVSTWYQKIRTSGDPDVHFSGFDMKKTPQGGRVQIKARSYQRDLVSAVSSLSESKLNALGLCLSIAINVKSPSPFDFLVIDDPIQSLDQEHETKFIDVIRDLVKQKKQVVLLSHNPAWLKQVRVACADLNGRAYEITGYTEAGPQISEIHWAENNQRLSTILGILNDQTADSVRLQHAEEEVRIVANQLAVDLLFKKTAKKKSAHSLNAEETKKILLSCGIEAAFANKIMSAFETVDPAHHAEKGYAPSRERIKAYYSWLKDLQQKVKDT